MNAAIDQAALLAMLARNSSLYNLLTRTDDDKDICEITIRSSQYGRKIREIKLPGDLLIVSVQRDGEFLIPTGDTQLENGDKLSLLGTIPCLERAQVFFE